MHVPEQEQYGDNQQSRPQSQSHSHTLSAPINPGITEKQRYAGHLGDFVDDPVRGGKLAQRCMVNKRSRACLALYTAIDIAHRLLLHTLIRPQSTAPLEQQAAHLPDSQSRAKSGCHPARQGDPVTATASSACGGADARLHRRDALKQAVTELQCDLTRIRTFLRPIFLDRRSFATQFGGAGDLDDRQSGECYGQLGGAALHCVIAEAVLQAELHLQQHVRCSLTWAVMLAMEPAMQAIQDNLMRQHRALETGAFTGCIFRMEWKKSIADMPPHLVAQHVILILNVPSSIRANAAAGRQLHDQGAPRQPEIM